jgi:hypothetical protein
LDNQLANSLRIPFQITITETSLPKYAVSIIRDIDNGNSNLKFRKYAAPQYIEIAATALFEPNQWSSS